MENQHDTSYISPLYAAYMQNQLAKQIQKKSPYRYVSTKGSGAYGKFTVTKDIRPYTKANLFSEVGKETKIFVRFSTMFSEVGSPDAVRDIRGFSVKFYTDEGNWDLVGSNFPVFYVKEPEKFGRLMQSHSKDSRTNLVSTTAKWNFFCAHPESLHQLLMLSSELGIPRGYRQMNGYGLHTYSFVNEKQERFWVKFHLRSQQGTQNFSENETAEVSNDYAQEDLVNAIDSGENPKWTLYIQIMSDEEANEYRWNPFDPTKVWLHEDFPLIEVGELELNKLPEDYFMHVEQATFSPGNLVPGIGLSPDKILQSRIFSYSEAQRTRTGMHADQLEVNRNPHIQPHHLAAELSGNSLISYTNYENEDDHYTQAGLFYTKALDDQGRATLIENIVNSMKEISGPARLSIINRQLCHYFRANIELGVKIAMGLQINIDANMMSHTMNSF